MVIIIIIAIITIVIKASPCACSAASNAVFSFPLNSRPQCCNAARHTIIIIIIININITAIIMDTIIMKKIIMNSSLGSICPIVDDDHTIMMIMIFIIINILHHKFDDDHKDQGEPSWFLFLVIDQIQPIWYSSNWNSPPGQWCTGGVGSLIIFSRDTSLTYRSVVIMINVPIILIIASIIVITYRSFTDIHMLKKLFSCDSNLELLFRRWLDQRPRLQSSTGSSNTCTAERYYMQIRI